MALAESETAMRRLIISIYCSTQDDANTLVEVAHKDHDLPAGNAFSVNDEAGNGGVYVVFETTYPQALVTYLGNNPATYFPNG